MATASPEERSAALATASPLWPAEIRSGLPGIRSSRARLAAAATWAPPHGQFARRSRSVRTSFTLGVPASAGAACACALGCSCDHLHPDTLLECSHVVGGGDRENL